MRATGLPSRAKKLPLGRWLGAPSFYKEGWVQNRPLIAQCAHWGTFPREGFERWERSEAVVGLFHSPCLSLIWNLLSKMLSSIFFLENASQIGLGISEKLPLCRIRNNHHKNQRVGTSGHKNRVRAEPQNSFLRLSSKKVRLPPESAEPRCRVHPATVSTDHLPMTEAPASFSHSREKWGPPPVGGAPEALRPQGGFRHPRGAAPGCPW